MKKRILAVLLLLCLSVMLFAEEADEPKKQRAGRGLDWNISLGLSFPVIPVFDALPILQNLESISAVKFVLPVATMFSLTSLTVGGGIQYTVIPGLLAPGIYADVHFNLPSFLIVKLLKDDNLILFQGGIRLYNQFKFGNFSLEPFFGGNFLYAGMGDFKEPLTFMAAGLKMNIRKFGLEYAFNFAPKKKAEEYLFPRMHRFAFVWRLNPRK